MNKTTTKINVKNVLQHINMALDDLKQHKRLKCSKKYPKLYLDCLEGHLNYLKHYLEEGE